MKIRSFGVLTAFCVLLSSATVWSLTEPETTPMRTGMTGWGSGTTRVAQSGDPARFTVGDTLRLEGRLGHPVLRAGQTNESFVLVNVTGQAKHGVVARAPLSLAIVIDRSGSMAGRRLENALQAARSALSRLRDGDEVSIVSYSDTARIEVFSTRLDGFSRARITRAIDNIESGGNTCISCGIETALGELGRAGQNAGRVLLLSDGEATTGVTDISGFERLAERARARGVALSSIGVDLEYNERVLATLASVSNGRHYFVRNAGDLARAFEQELSALENAVAKNAEVELDLAPGVEAREVIDRGFRRESGRVVVPLGTLSEGETATVLVRVALPAQPSGTQPVGKVRLSFSDAAGRGTSQAEGSLVATLTGDESKLSVLDSIVSTRLARRDTAEALTRANELWKSGDAKAAARATSSSLAALKKDKSSALRSAPKSRAAAIERDFDRQEAALDKAARVFAKPPPPAGAPASSEGKNAVKENQVEAFQFTR